MNLTRTLTLWTLLAVLCLPSVAQPPICSTAGNVVIYSNYDGGDLEIVVDENIPDLHIGVVSYEFTRINISGPFVNNVTAVWYAGYNSSNDNCNTGAMNPVTTINGVPLGITDIFLYPPTTWANANGYSDIICAYSCDINSNQGGCNTVDQIAHYFLSNWGGILRYQLTQYQCWTGQQLLSAGGNCCEDPLSTAVEALEAPLNAPVAYPNPANEQVFTGLLGAVQVMDATGRPVHVPRLTNGALDVSQLPSGAYSYRSLVTGSSAAFVVQR